MTNLLDILLCWGKEVGKKSRVEGGLRVRFKKCKDVGVMLLLLFFWYFVHEHEFNIIIVVVLPPTQQHKSHLPSVDWLLTNRRHNDYTFQVSFTLYNRFYESILSYFPPKLFIVFFWQIIYLFIGVCALNLTLFLYSWMRKQYTHIYISMINHQSPKRYLYKMSDKPWLSFANFKSKIHFAYKLYYLLYT